MPKNVSVGLDIGSSAVRAAEVVIDGDKKVLRRFAQVGLASGAVVEGEVRDQPAVVAAIKRLWLHGRFSTKNVVVGLSSQRTMVRQVEMPPMPDKELRTALQFKIGEFLPIPVEQAVVDFASLGGDGPSGARRMLLVAAQRDVVVDQVRAVENAGLRVRAVDSSSLALLRAVAPRKPEGRPGSSLEAVVGFGAQLVTVAVRDSGVPRFVRTVALAEPAANQNSPDAFAGASSAFARRRSAGPGVTSEAPGTWLEAVVGEVRSSLEYLLSQSESGQFAEVLLSGGGAMHVGVTEALGQALGLPVKLAEPAFEVDAKALGLEGEALTEASYRWLTAAGLALWGTEAYGKPSLMPTEVIVKRQQRQLIMGAAAALAVLVCALGLVYYSKVQSAESVSNQIRSSQAEGSALQVKIKSLGHVTQVPAEISQRRELAAAALSGDIDWTGLLERIAKALPADVTVQSVQLNKTEPLTPGGGGATPETGEVVGSITMSAATAGGAPAVKRFIDKVSVVKGLSALWVSSTTSATGLTSIQAAAQVTTGAFSIRAAQLPGGAK